MKKTVLLKNLLLLSLLSILPAIFLGAGDSQAGTPTDGTATGVDLEPIAKDHLAQKLGVDSPTLVLKRNNCLKADPCTISFTQVYQNIPVFGSSATVWFKKGQIIETRSPLLAKNLPSSLEPQLKEEEAHKLVFGWLKGEKYELIGEPISSTGLTLYVFQIWAQPKAKTAPDDSTGSAQLAYRVDLKRLRRPPHLAEDDMFFSQPTFIIDANEGQILEIIENLSYGTVAGNITGPVYPTNPYEGSSLVPFGRESVEVNGFTTQSDADGHYSIEVPGDAATVRSSLRSDRLILQNNAQPVSEYRAETLLDDLDHSWNWTDHDQSYSLSEDPLFADVGFAEVYEEGNVYYHINQAQDYFDRGDYPFNIVPTPSPMIATVQEAVGCNAYAGADGLFFLGTPSTGRCLASSLDPTVVIHEFSHRVVAYFNAAGGRNMQGAMNEGFADYFAGSILNEERFGFFTGGMEGNSSRRLLNDRLYPEDYYTGAGDSGGVHFNTSIFSGILWDARSSLGQTVSDDLILRTMEFHGERPHAEKSFGNFCLDLVQIDDSAFGNSDLLDGTPHLDGICTGCYNHGISMPYCLTCSGGDSDGDGWADGCDNCPDVFDDTRLDSDTDGIGDACDNCPFDFNRLQTDTDGDGAGDGCDNCPLVPNEDQGDADNDGLGDACDTGDGDTIPFETDNCPSHPNEDQRDHDGDGLGDVCDPDDDNDTIEDLIDNCQFVSNLGQEDTDVDFRGEACDNCPSVTNLNQLDHDTDGTGDACDTDDDNDGTLDDADNCLFDENADQVDTDSDGAGDACEICPGNPDSWPGQYHVRRWVIDELTGPWDVEMRLAADLEGNIYVADVLTARILKFTDNRELIWQSQGLRRAYQIEVDGNNNLVSLDFNASHPELFPYPLLTTRNPAGVVLRTVAAQFLPTTRVGRVADFKIDGGFGDYYFATMEGQVYKLDPFGRLLLSWNTRDPGELNSTVSLAIDSAGRVYVSDRAHHRVKVYNRIGEFITEWDTEGFYYPNQIEIDRDDNVFISYNDMRHLSMFDTMGNFVMDLAEGRAGPLVQLAVSPQGTIYARVSTPVAIPDDQIDIYSLLPDDDGDRIHNSCDNCPTVANPDQSDLDADGIGDVCDLDYACFDSDGDSGEAAENPYTVGGYVDYQFHAVFRPETTRFPLGDDRYRTFDGCINSGTLSERGCTPDAEGNQRVQYETVSCADIDPGFNCIVNTETGSYCGPAMCSTNADCAAGEICRSDGVCIVPACEDTDQALVYPGGALVPGRVRSNREPVPGAVPEYNSNFYAYDDSSCAAGYAFIEYACASDNSVISVDMDCRHNVCREREEIVDGMSVVRGYCSNCETDLDCAGGGVGTTCRNGICHDRCTTDADCTSPFVCQDAVCVVP